MTLHYFKVPRVDDITDLSALGITVKHRPERPDFLWDEETRSVFKSCGYILLLDDGTVRATYEDHLTEHEVKLFYGAVERAFTGGERLARHEGWRRRRRSSKRKHGYWIEHVYVPIREGEAFTQISVAMAAPPYHERMDAQREAIEREMPQSA